MGEVAHLGRGHPHLLCKLDQIKMRDYMDRRVTPPTREQVFKLCTHEVVQCICIIISDQPLLFWLLLFSHFIIFFLVKKRKPLFSNPIEVNYLVTVYK